MSNCKAKFSVRNFLKERGVLLVHFSTPMTNHVHLFFPNDLKNAITLQDRPISFSTILPSDVGPYQSGRKPEMASAGGSVGIVVDIQDDGYVVTVGPSDDGTHFDQASNKYQSAGSAPSPEACARSIDERETSNEWFVQNYKTIGIFIFCPIVVRRRVTIGSLSTHGETEIGLNCVLRAFPEHRVFTTRDGRFLEFDRKAQGWSPVEYDAILAPG